MLRTMESLLAGIFCTSRVLLLKQYNLMCRMISQQTPEESTASGVLSASEEHPSNWSKIVASPLLGQTRP